MLVLVLMLALSARPVSSWRVTQKQKDGASALFLAALRLRHPQMAVVQTLSVALLKATRQRRKERVAGTQPSRRCGCVCQRHQPEDRRGAPHSSFGAAEAAFHVD